MRVSNSQKGMKIRQNERGEIEVSMAPVELKYKRRCGWVVEWRFKEEPCPCYKCTQERLR
jgi:hypothetical protein